MTDENPSNEGSINKGLIKKILHSRAYLPSSVTEIAISTLKNRGRCEGDKTMEKQI